MPRAALKTSRIVGDLLRQKRSELGLTLREVSERLGENGDAIPTSTLARIEQGKLDPGVRRLHHLLRLYNVPPHLVADLVQMEEAAVEPLPAGGNLEENLRDGVEALRQGNLAKGLAHLFSVRQSVPADEASSLLRQRATLGFAIAARNMGKFRLARQIVDDLLLEPPHASLTVNVLVLASTVWQGLGSLHASAAFIHEAERCDRSGDSLCAAWVLHQKAKVLSASGDRAEAEVAIDGALLRYRKAKDTYGEGRALISRIGILELREDFEGGLRCAEAALEIAERHEHGQLSVLARIELGRLRARSGDAETGLRSLRKALGEAILMGDRHAQFVAHYYLWKGHEMVGDLDRARLELEAASYFVRFVDDQSPESLEIHRLAQAKARPS